MRTEHSRTYYVVLHKVLFSIRKLPTLPAYASGTFVHSAKGRERVVQFPVKSGREQKVTSPGENARVRVEVRRVRRAVWVESIVVLLVGSLVV
jgi:hypothetical protein